jgi:hypothetical protein
MNADAKDTKGLKILFNLTFGTPKNGVQFNPETTDATGWVDTKPEKMGWQIGSSTIHFFDSGPIDPMMMNWCPWKIPAKTIPNQLCPTNGAPYPLTIFAWDSNGGGSASTVGFIRKTT